MIYSSLCLLQTGHRLQGWEWDKDNSMQHRASDQHLRTASTPLTTPANVSRLSIHAFVPPATDARTTLQRVDDVNTVLRMLGEAQTSTVVLTGDGGAGKSTLAALVYRRLQTAGIATGAAVAAQPAFSQFVWLSLGPNATLPDCLAALISTINAGSLPTDFFLLKPDQQIALLFYALSRAQGGVFVVLNQFEELLDSETSGYNPLASSLAGRGAMALLLAMFQQDLGSSRVIFTSSRSPYSAQNDTGQHVRSYLVSRVSMPEGVALLQQRGVQANAPELSLVWQRCDIYAIVLFCALNALSGFSSGYLLNSPDYQYLWNGDVTLNLISLVYNFLNPIQRSLLRALCLFSEPVPLDGMLAAITGDDLQVDTLPYQRELATLLHLSIIQQSAGEHDSYVLHRCIRQYTVEHYLERYDRRSGGNLDSAVGVASQPNPMASNPETRDIALAAGHMRVAAYYQRLANSQYTPRQERKFLRQIEPLLEVIQHLCLGWHWQQACDLFFAEALHDDLMQWGAWHTLIRLYTAMIPPAGIVARYDEALIYSHLGLLYGRLGDYQQSARYYQQALATQREINDLHGQAVTLINQGELLRGAGNMQEARANFEQALQIIEQKPDERLQSVLLHNMGLLAQNAKEYPQALQYYLHALKLAQQLHEPYNQGIILTNMGMLFFEQGRLPESLSLLQYALRIRQEARDPTVNALARFLDILAQKLGPEAIAQLQQ